MSSKGRDLLKLGSVVAIAFAAGLLFASALNLPRPGQAEARHPVNIVTGPPMSLRTADGVLPSFADIAEKVRPSVVYITVLKREQSPQMFQVPPGFDDFFRRFQMPQRPQITEGSGSGFIVSQDGYILTNNHVVAGADKVRVTLLDHREFDARVVGRDPATDVAVIKIDADHLAPLPFGNSDQARVGDWVLAIGNPLNLQFTVTAGIVSAKGRPLAGLQDASDRYQIQDYIQTDAAINPGNSGGPLVNLEGEVIGINAAIASQTGFYAGYGFAVPINLARHVMDDLIATGHVERAILGIAIANATGADAQAVGMSQIRGVVVKSFSSDHSPAQAAGLQLGDVIVALNDTAIDHVAQLQTMVGFKRPGEVVHVTFVHASGRQQNANVRLAAAEPADTAELASTSGSTSDSASSMASRKLGIDVQGMTPDLIQAAGVPADLHGPVVAGVEDYGPASGHLAAADDGSPDVILYVNQSRVRTRDEFLRAIAPLRKGDVVSLRVTNLGDKTHAVRIERIQVR